MKKYYLLAALAIAVFIALSAYFGNDLEWTEDVRLPDGRIVTLSRSAEFKGGTAPFGKRQTESKQRFEFRDPESGKSVIWTNTKTEGRLRTLALGISNGKPWLLSTPAYGNDLYMYKCPGPPYLLFEYANGVWASKPLAQIPVKRIRANMTTNVLEASASITNGNIKLSADQTGNSYTNYEGMPVQTFDNNNCSMGSSRMSWLLVDEERK